MKLKNIFSKFSGKNKLNPAKVSSITLPRMIRSVALMYITDVAVPRESEETPFVRTKVWTLLVSELCVNVFVFGREGSLRTIGASRFY